MSPGRRKALVMSSPALRRARSAASGRPITCGELYSSGQARIMSRVSSKYTLNTAAMSTASASTSHCC